MSARGNHPLGNTWGRSPTYLAWVALRSSDAWRLRKENTFVIKFTPLVQWQKICVWVNFTDD